MQMVVRLAPRTEKRVAKLVFSGSLSHAWDIPQQTVRWPVDFVDALPALACIAVGEALADGPFPEPNDPDDYAFAAWLTTGLFDILQRKPAPDGEILHYIRAKVLWSYRFGLTETTLDIGDSARLGVTVEDLMHVAYPQEGEFWARIGASTLKPTPAFLRSATTPAPPKRSPESGAVFDVALSFAGEQRAYVEVVATLLKNAGIRVFYDNQEDLWGSDLTKRLEQVYRRQSRFVVVFVSREYISKAWPNLERQHALTGRIERMDDSVLPARFEALDLPGLPGSVGYLDISAMTPEALVERVLTKLRS